MQDFTLGIPTYNRPNQLGALLTYLSAKRPQCRVLILDASEPRPRAAKTRQFSLGRFKGMSIIRNGQHGSA
jgi:hypothetical protein